MKKAKRVEKKPYVLECFSSRPAMPRLARCWYWRLKCRRNGKIVADGGEDYANKSNVMRAIKALPLDWDKVEVKEL